MKGPHWGNEVQSGAIGRVKRVCGLHPGRSATDGKGVLSLA